MYRDVGAFDTVHGRTGEAVNRDIPRLKMYALRHFKHFSHYADKEGIGQYVGEYFDPTNPSSLEIPLVMHLVISQGIEVFTTHRS
jgi:hypothetical protein